MTTIQKVWEYPLRECRTDTVASRKFAGVLKAALGSRVTLVVIPNAGHALTEEQPQVMSEAIAAFARALEVALDCVVRMEIPRPFLQTFS